MTRARCGSSDAEQRRDVAELLLQRAVARLGRALVVGEPQQHRRDFRRIVDQDREVDERDGVERRRRIEPHPSLVGRIEIAGRAAAAAVCSAATLAARRDRSVRPAARRPGAPRADARPAPTIVSDAVLGQQLRQASSSTSRDRRSGARRCRSATGRAARRRDRCRASRRARGAAGARARARRPCPPPVATSSTMTSRGVTRNDEPIACCRATPTPSGTRRSRRCTAGWSRDRCGIGARRAPAAAGTLRPPQSRGDRSPASSGAAAGRAAARASARGPFAFAGRAVLSGRWPRS